MSSGVYAITNTLTGEQYIGKAKSIDVRWSQHRSGLLRGDSPHHRLQHSWEQYGAQAFRFDVLEVVPPRPGTAYVDWQALRARERVFIETLRPALNGNSLDPKVHISMYLHQSVIDKLAALGDGDPRQGIYSLIMRQV